MSRTQQSTICHLRMGTSFNLVFNLSSTHCHHCCLKHPCQHQVHPNPTLLNYNPIHLSHCHCNPVDPLIPAMSTSTHPASWPWSDHAQISLIHSPTPPKCSTRALMGLINNLGIVYHQYCSSSYLDLSFSKPILARSTTPGNGNQVRT